MGVCLLAITTFAFVSSVFPYTLTAEKFYVLAMLGEDKAAENYFPNDDPNLHGLEEVSWYIYVQNFMQQVQYVLVKVKVLSSTMTLPDSVTCQSSPENELLNLTLFLTNGQSTLVPFFWHVADLSSTNESLILEKIVVNGMSAGLNVGAANGTSFHLVFELWHYDPILQDFRFDWDSGFGLRCAWNQMIFDVSE